MVLAVIQQKGEHLSPKFRGMVVTPLNACMFTFPLDTLEEPVFGDTYIEHFPRPNGIIERLHHLFDGRKKVPDMDTIHIDVVGPQAFQTRFKRLHQILALSPGYIGIAWPWYIW